MLGLTLGPEFENRGASMDGQPVLVLFDGRVPYRELREWSPPSSAAVKTPQGWLAAIGCRRDYCSGVGTDQEKVLTSAVALVMPGTGDVWIGPEVWRWVGVGGRLLGLGVNSEQTELLVFAGPQGRIPRSEGSIEAFHKALLEFERTFKANQYQWKPDLRVRIADLFPGDKRFPMGNGFSLRLISFKDENIILFMGSEDTKVRSEITLSPELKILSTRVFELETPALQSLGYEEHP